MTLRISGISSDECMAFWSGGADSNGQPALLRVAEGIGNPCRHCLRLIPSGQGKLVLAYRPFPGLQPYAETGPIFLHVDPCARYRAGKPCRTGSPSSILRSCEGTAGITGSGTRPDRSFAARRSRSPARGSSPLWKSPTFTCDRSSTASSAEWIVREWGLGEDPTARARRSRAARSVSRRAANDRIARLRLVSMGPDLLRALIAGGRTRAEELLGARFPDETSSWSTCFASGWLSWRRNPRTSPGSCGRRPHGRGPRDRRDRVPRATGWRMAARLRARRGRIRVHDLRGRPAAGICGEASEALVAWASKEYGVRSYVLSIGPDNEASIGVAGRLDSRRSASGCTRSGGGARLSARRPDRLPAVAHVAPRGARNSRGCASFEVDRASRDRPIRLRRIGSSAPAIPCPTSRRAVASPEATASGMLSSSSRSFRFGKSTVGVGHSRNSHKGPHPCRMS